ncbi:hypothetical protein FH608_006410 [Nonomuraea phyllanthi]|uniref:Uncharacterized protein n=1 Tax=Nonomuraea phyllanthi TaxID=2219224 RepID=A0A5C4WS40_9ACTN|nr:hypothetical protein [Nonomuraea phyllanthi]KAB8196383.1 hypothetical protein FH608_006410 [Nonomuraea phyllanthi]QFY05304.1 hypothetical protein GBF35_00145 [Nonomuraea phyllanthi]
MSFLFRSALAGLGVVVSLVLLVHLPAPEQDDQIQLATTVLLAPFPLSALGAFLARLPGALVIGLVAPFVMLTLSQLLPETWVSEKGPELYLALGVPVMAGFMITAPLGLLASSLRARVLGKLKPAPRAEQP